MRGMCVGAGLVPAALIVARSALAAGPGGRSGWCSGKGRHKASPYSDPSGQDVCLSLRGRGEGEHLRCNWREIGNGWVDASLPNSVKGASRQPYAAGQPTTGIGPGSGAPMAIS